MSNPVKTKFFKMINLVTGCIMLLARLDISVVSLDNVFWTRPLPGLMTSNTKKNIWQWHYRACSKWLVPFQQIKNHFRVQGRNDRSKYKLNSSLKGWQPFDLYLDFTIECRILHLELILFSYLESFTKEQIWEDLKLNS